MLKNGSPSVNVTSFGCVENDEVSLIELSAGTTRVKLMNYGATMVSIEVPDVNGVIDNVIAGFSSLDGYLGDHPYLGSLVGRFANRIAKGVFRLDGTSFQLSVNSAPNHLHGGLNGFHRKVWNVESNHVDDNQCSVVFSLLSKDGDEGYPGNMKINVKFTVTTSNELQVTFNAFADKPSPINLTNHPYFNLSGFKSATIYDHQLVVNSFRYTEKDSADIPTGRILENKDTPHDFRSGKHIGLHIHELSHDQGYNHNYVVEPFDRKVKPVAKVVHCESGRVLEIDSDLPGVQVYTANLWDGTMVGSHGTRYVKHSAIALETQLFPDSPNHENFPNSILKPGELWYSQTIYRFKNI